MAVGLLMKAGNVSEELAVLNNEHSLNASLDTICGTMGSLVVVVLVVALYLAVAKIYTDERFQRFYCEY